jgi:hypothetical protein
MKRKAHTDVLTTSITVVDVGVPSRCVVWCATINLVVALEL